MKPRIKYDSPNGVWLCGGYWGHTPKEAYILYALREVYKVSHEGLRGHRVNSEVLLKLWTELSSK